MNTELNLGGKNWNVFASILKKHFETKYQTSLNDYTYSENGIDVEDRVQKSIDAISKMVDYLS